jgi:hypothetical protein
MRKNAGQGQRGGVNISGLVGSSGDITGRDKVVKVGGVPTAVPASLDSALASIIEVIKMAPADKRAEAEKKIDGLKHEIAKGKDANDTTVAKLIDGLVGLIPAAATAVVSAFATPILAGLAGPVTKFVLDKLRG